MTCRPLKAVVDENADLCEKAMKIIKVFTVYTHDFNKCCNIERLYVKFMQIV